MISVGVEGLRGAKAHIKSQSFWVSPLTPAFRVECVIAELRCTGKQENTIDAYAYNLVRVRKLQEWNSISSCCSNVPDIEP